MNIGTRSDHFAMAAPFSIWIADAEEAYARQACQAAFRELERLEVELSRFQSASDIGILSRLQPGETVVLTADAFECLQLAQTVAAETGGAFDVTIGALFKCWRNGSTAEELAAARARTGWELILLDAATHRATVAAPGVQVDLGAIGKGFALDRMAEVLLEWELPHALLSAGGSTVLALEPPAGHPGWPVTTGTDTRPRSRQALSGSGTAVQGDHILDPRTGEPVRGRTMVWSQAASAARADALSTAFFVMPTAEVAAYCQQHPDVGALLEEQGKELAFNWRIDS